MAFNEVTAVDTPTYEQIFTPPSEGRDPNKKYGRQYLIAYCRNTQNLMYCANQATIRRWVKEVEEKYKDLRHKLDKQQEILEFIQSRHHEIKPLEFPGASYIWKVKDIYAYFLTIMQNNRKQKKKKMARIIERSTLKSNTSLDGENSKDNQEEVGQQSEVSKNEENDDSNHNTCNPSEAEVENVYRPELPLHTQNDTNQIETDDNFDTDAIFHKYKSFTDLLVNATQIEETTSFNENSAFANSVAGRNRKSKRTPKWSEKMKDNIKEKRKRASKDLAIRDNSKGIDTSATLLNNHAKTHDKCQSSQTEFSEVDEETILLKYMDIPIVDELYTSLKSNFNMLKREPTFNTNRKEHNLDDMRRAIVEWLIAQKRVVIKDTILGNLSLHDVIIK